MKLLLIVLITLFLFLVFDCYCKNVNEIEEPKVNKTEESKVNGLEEIKQIEDPLHNKLVMDQLEEYVNLSNIPNYTQNNISSGTLTFQPITVEDYN